MLLALGYLIMFGCAIGILYILYEMIKPYAILVHAEYYIMLYKLQKGEMINWTDLKNQMKK